MRPAHTFKICSVILILVLLLQAQGASSSGISCQDGPASYEVEVKIDLGGHGQGEDARLWLAYPVSSAWQDVTNVRVEGDFSDHGVYSDGRYGDMLLYASWPPRASGRSLSLAFRVTRRPRDDRGKLAKAGQCADHALVEPFLHGSVLSPLSPRVRALAEEITAGRQDVGSRARAIYDWICDNMRRDPGAKGCGCGNVCLLLDTRKGKCADIHSVFVALLRAAGIPAREVFGLRLPSTGQADVTGWQHCWAEFYVPGSGWVAADPADYLKALVERRLPPFSKEAKRLRRYYFGQVDSCRVRLSVGRDLVLNPRQKAGPLNYLMYPYAEVGGRPLDHLSPSTFSYSIRAVRLDGPSANTKKGGSQ